MPTDPVPDRAAFVDLIQRNRISSTEVADALGKTGVLHGVHALNAGHFAAGPVAYVATYAESNWPLHEQIQAVPEGSVLYVDAFDCGERAVLGDLVAKYLFLYRRIQALVVNGYVRDAHRLRKENYPLWCRGATPLGCFNRPVEAATDLRARIDRRRRQFDGSLLVADDSGCTLVEPSRLNAETFGRLEFIEIQEDIWYYCIDTLKWSTYETICQKKYLDDPDVLPEMLRARLQDTSGS